MSKIKKRYRVKGQPKEYCFNCGKKRPQNLEGVFHWYYEGLSCDDEPDAWKQFGGWTEVFLDPDKIKSGDEEQLWFISLCPRCSNKLRDYLLKPTNERMSYCKITLKSIVVYADSVLSSANEQFYRTRGCRIIRYKTRKCPWRAEP